MLRALFESVLSTHTDFRDILRRMPNDNKISDILYDMIEKKLDIKTSFNAISTSNKNDDISFIPDSQFQRFVQKGEDPWTKTRSNSKVGRAIRQILSDNGHVFNDSKIEEFVNLFKAIWDKKNSVTKMVKMVDGDSILDWYSADTYASTDGTLGNSCMRAPSKRNYMKLYADNPDKISMVILIEDNKLLARAILWKLDESTNGEKFFLDRIYTKNDSDRPFIYNWVLENVANNNHSLLADHMSENIEYMKVDLNHTDFPEYPYADTFNHLYNRLEDGKIVGDGFVSSRDVSKKHKDYKASTLQEQDGSHHSFTHLELTREKIWVPTSDVVHVAPIGLVLKSDTTYCDYLSIHFLKEDTIFSESMKDWIPKSKSIDHPKYGHILKESLISVVTEYAGTETDPISIYSEYSKYPEEKFKFKEVIKSDTGEYFTSRSQYGSFFHKDMKVSDVWGNNRPEIFCYKIFKAVSPLDNINKDLCYPIDDSFITKEDAEYFGIKINDSTGYVSASEYISEFRYTFFAEYLKIKDTHDATEEVKKRYDDRMKAIHEYLLSQSSHYREVYNLGLILLDTNQSIGGLLIEVVSNSVDNNIPPQNTIKNIFINNGVEYSDITLYNSIQICKMFCLSYQIFDEFNVYEISRLLRIEYPDRNVAGYISVAQSIAREIKYRVHDGVDEEIRKIPEVSSSSITPYAIRRIISDTSYIDSEVFKLFKTNLK